MKILKMFLCFLLSVILICSAMVLQLSLSLKHDIFNNKFYLEKIDSSKIYDKLEKSIDGKFYDYASKNKIPTSATTDIISTLWIQKQFTTVTNGIISYILIETDVLPVIDSKTPIDKFNLNLTQKLAERNQPVDNVINASKQEFLKSFNEIPFTEAWKKLHEDNLKDTLNSLRKYVPILNLMPYLSAFILLVCILLLFLATTKLVGFKSWTGYSLIIGGLIPSITSFIISNSSIVNTYLTNNVNISKTSIFPPKATVTLLTDIINGFFVGVTKYGAILVFLGIAIILIVSLFDTKKDNVFWYKHKPLK